MVYNPMQALEAFGAGRQFATQNRVGRALADGDMRGAEQAAFRGGDVGAGMSIQRARAEAAQQARQARAQMDERQAAAALQNIQRVGGVATGILSQVPEEQIDAYTREAVSRMGLSVPLPDRPITRADLEVFAAQAEAMAGELTAARDRNQVTLGQNEALVRREGGQDRQTLNQQGVRIQGENERSARAGEAIDRFEADTGRMNAVTGRMGEVREQRQAEAELERVSAGLPDDPAAAEDSLRSEWNALAGDTAELFRSYETLNNSYNQNSAEGDLAMIVAFTKALDPGSVAREGEVRLAQSTAGVAQNAQNWMRRIREGGTRLPNEVRQGIIEWANAQRQIDEQSYNAALQNYQGIVQRRRLNADNVFARQAEVSVEANTGNSGGSQYSESNPAQLPADQAAASRVYASLPSGAFYVSPDGQMRQKR